MSPENSNNKPQKNTLPAASRIKSKKLFDRLFEKGEAIYQAPIRLVFLPIPFNMEEPVKLGVSAPKRRMKRAVDRNRMKRLMREAFRLNKEKLIEHCHKHQKGYAILFISQCNTLPDYSKTEEKIILLLRRLISTHAK
jgi:ribonuclease P protein component